MVVLLGHHVADQKRRLGKIGPREHGQSRIDARHAVALLLVQRLGDAQERIRYAAGGVGERRLRAAAILQAPDQIDEHGLLAPIGQFLAQDLDGCVAPALTGQHTRVGLQHAHGRRAGLGHRAGQSRRRLVQTSAQVKHHCLVITVQRA